MPESIFFTTLTLFLTIFGDGLDFNASPSNSVKMHEKPCPLGTCSYKSFGIDPPAGTPICTVLRAIPLSSDTEDLQSSQLDVIKCPSNGCTYDALEIRQLSTFESTSWSWNLLQRHIPSVRTLSITNENEDEDERCNGNIDLDLPPNSVDTTWTNLEWLRVHHVIDCPLLLHAVQSWTAPKLRLIQLDSVFISYSNSKPISKLLTRHSANLTSLILKNISLCSRCRIFSADSDFSSVENVVLNWKSPKGSSLVSAQTETFLQTVRNLKEFRTNAEFSANQIKRISEKLVNLESAEFVFILPLNENKYNCSFSLKILSQFSRLSNVKIHLKLRKMKNKSSLQLKGIEVTDFNSVSNILKNVTIVSDSVPFAINLRARKLCNTRLQITENVWKCERTH